MPFILRHTDIRIQAGPAWLDAFTGFAPDVRGLIICAVPYLPRLRDARETRLCQTLEKAGFGTLLLSLLTPYEEARDPDARYDISLMTQRLQATTAWIEHQPIMEDLPLGLIGSSTIAAAAMRLTSQQPERFSALVSKAGRIDLAGAEPLRRATSPALVLMPEHEPGLQQATSAAFSLLGCKKELKLIEGASEGFIEPGTLETAAQAASRWFCEHMPEANAEPIEGERASAASTK